MDNEEKNKTLIIICEDDHTTAHLIKTILEINYYNCITAENGYILLDLMKEHKPDLILLDLMMPVIDGITTLKEIKKIEEYKEIPIIILTAMTDSNMIKEGFESGCLDFISKPFKNLELITRINSVIKNQKQKQNLIKNKEKLEVINSKIIKQSSYYETQNIQLKKLDEIKDNFMASITHDFKTPLTSIRSVSELIYENPEVAPEKLKSYMEIIIDQVDTISDIIQSTLNSIKKINAMSEIKKENLNIESFCSSIVDNYSTLAKMKNILFEFKFNSEIDTIYADPVKVKEILYNLLSNALKYTEKGSISFMVTSDSSKIYFSVSDTGIGIPQDKIDSIFDKFYRINDKSDVNGDGLGLYISRKIAQAHNGDISVTSEAGAGSNFIFYIPINE